MKVAINLEVLDYEGKPVKDGEKNLTWKTVVFHALNSMMLNEQMPAEDKSRAYQITMKAYQHKEPDYSIDERSFIIERVKKIFDPLVVGRAVEFFDKEEPAEKSN